MGVMTMKELCEYSIQQKKLRARGHRLKHEHSGQCSGLTDKEYKRVRSSQKSTFAKARKFTHNRLWKDYSVNYKKIKL